MWLSKKKENKYRINFLTDNEERFFGEKISNGEIEFSKMTNILNEIQKYKCTENDAITVYLYF